MARLTWRSQRAGPLQKPQSLSTKCSLCPTIFPPTPTSEGPQALELSGQWGSGWPEQGRPQAPSQPAPQLPPQPGLPLGADTDVGQRSGFECFTGLNTLL